MSYYDYPLDVTMSHSYFESFPRLQREPHRSPRESFSSDRTLVNTPQVRRPAMSHGWGRLACSRTTSTSTITTQNSTDTRAPTQGKRKKVKKVKGILKRVGNGMLESLAYSSGAVTDYYSTDTLTSDEMDRRSSDQVMGDVYGVQLLIW